MHNAVMMCLRGLFLCLVAVHIHVNAFTLMPTTTQRTHSARRARNLMLPQLTMTTNQSQRRMGELTKPENTVYDILEEISQSGYAFRVVTIGKGAILESTVNCLGPVIRLTQSPSTGANLLTLASEDQSFEFHIQLCEVSKIVLVEKETPAKTLRIIRMLNAEGESMTSLILADPSEEALQWYHKLVETRGGVIQL